MIKAAHLWAVAYDNMDRAEQVRVEVTRLSEKHCLILRDSAVAVRYPDGIVTLDGEPFVSVPYLRSHSFASFLAGLALAAPPLTASTAGAFARAADNKVDEVGIREDFIREVQALMKPGTSALFVLDDEGDMEMILHKIQGLGGTVLKTNVVLERAKLIQSTLAATAESYF